MANPSSITDEGLSYAGGKPTRIKALHLSTLDMTYLLDVLRGTAMQRCNKSNCGTVCMCLSCAAKRVLAALGET